MERKEIIGKRKNNMKIQLAIIGILLLFSCNKRKEYVKFYANGQLEVSGTLVDGKKDGMFTNYWENGNIMYKSTYDKGIQTGYQYCYSELGFLHSMIPFENNDVNGTAYWFNKKGNIIKIINFLNNKKHGLKIMDGTFLGEEVIDSTYYLNGIKNGTSRIYLKKDGKIILDAKYKNVDLEESISYNWEEPREKGVYEKKYGSISRIYKYPEMLLFKITNKYDTLGFIFFSYKVYGDKPKVEKKGKLDFLTHQDSLTLDSLYGKDW